jgi:hypothetical protein
MYIYEERERKECIVVIMGLVEAGEEERMTG